MKLYASRESVAIGDDVDAPHSESFSFPDGTGLKEIILGIAQSGYLASIIGGQATWSVTSNVPVAVVAQQWDAPRMIHDAFDDLDNQNGVLRLHFNYHAQIDPDTVYEVLWKLSLHAW